MPSSFTQNLNLEKPATGEQAGTWGNIANLNYDTLDAAVAGGVSVTFPNQPTVGNPYHLSSTQSGAATIPSGANRVITFTGPQSAVGFVQIDPNSAHRVYIVSNQTTDSANAGNRWAIVFRQIDSGGQTFQLEQGYSAIIYANGGGASANVVGALDNAQFSSILVANQSNPGQTVLAVRAAPSQTAPVFLCQNSGSQNILALDNVGNLNVRGGFGTQVTGELFTGVSQMVHVTGADGQAHALGFAGGILVSVA